MIHRGICNRWHFKCTFTWENVSCFTYLIPNNSAPFVRLSCFECGIWGLNSAILLVLSCEKQLDSMNVVDGNVLTVLQEIYVLVFVLQGKQNLYIEYLAIVTHNDDKLILT